MSQIKMIPLDQIGVDAQYYPRVNGHEDWQTVLRYTEALKTHPEKADPHKPGAFPPVVVVKATGYEWPFLLLDGLHRTKAFAASGVASIGAVVERIPQSKWLQRSVELNIDGKRPLDQGDKCWVAMRLKHEGWEDAAIASLLCMQTGSFQKLMATKPQKLTKSAARKLPVGRSNRAINGDNYGFLKAPFGALSGSANAQTALREQGAVSSSTGRQIVEAFIALLDSKAIDVTDEHLMQRLTVAAKLLDDLVAATA